MVPRSKCQEQTQDILLLQRQQYREYMRVVHSINSSPMASRPVEDMPSLYMPFRITIITLEQIW